MNEVKTLHWAREKIQGAIVGAVHAAKEVYAIVIGGALLICHTDPRDDRQHLIVTRYTLDAGGEWTVSSVTTLLAELRVDDVIPKPGEILDVLERLPNLARPQRAELALSLILGAAATPIMFVWALTPYTAIPRVPKKIQIGDIQVLREQVRTFMREKRISQKKFADRAGLSLATLVGFLKNTIDSRDGTVTRIEHALTVLQNEMELEAAQE